MSTSSIALAPLKVICTQSGYAPPVPSLHVPPAPYPTPRRSPLFTAVAGYPPHADDAVATPPLADAATLTRPPPPAGMNPEYKRRLDDPAPRFERTPVVAAATMASRTSCGVLLPFCAR